MQDFVKWLVAGSIGGAIGVAIWVAVGYFTSYEIGWTAWGVGFLVGLGVRAGAGDVEGLGPGVVAGGMSVGAILIAKFLVISFLVSDAMPEQASFDQISSEQVIASFAGKIAEEQEAAGKTINWPAEVENLDVPPEQCYPQDIWAEAKQRWQKLTPEEQEQATEDLRTEVVNGVEQFEADVRDIAFKESFTPWDFLWFGLAVFTSFKVGSGMASDD